MKNIILITVILIISTIEVHGQESKGPEQEVFSGFDDIVVESNLQIRPASVNKKPQPQQFRVRRDDQGPLIRLLTSS
uniref:CSON004365 protein n=1 Tax=Culicoides sonorensis TaxID=179676 RepID=A0A336LWV0_CULSO